MGMNTVSGIHVTKSFPCGKRFKNQEDGQYQLTQLPAQFDPVFPPRDPEVPEAHEPAVVIPEPPQPRGPPGAPQFPRHVWPSPGPSYQRLRRDVDRNNYLLEWVVAELQEHRQRSGLPPLPFITDVFMGSAGAATGAAAIVFFSFCYVCITFAVYIKLFVYI
ncbi:hypothetical protein Hdeb2414_s0011g00375841 [Helianthus debilis subsp. tardiflorus]